MPEESYGIYADGEDRDRFLNIFPINWWVWVANLMSMPLYLGRSDNQAVVPEELLTMTKSRINERLRSRSLDAAQRTALEELLAGLDYRYAIYYALELLENEGGVDKAILGKLAFTKKPSEEQLRFLSDLGYDGPKPVYLSEAWLLIDRIKERGLGYC